MKRLVISVIISFTLLFSSVNLTFAQGSYNCAWLGIGPVGSCNVGGASCEGGFSVPSPSGCDGLPNEACTAMPDLPCACTDPPCTPGGPVGGTVVNGPSIQGCGIDTAIGCIPIQDQNELALFFLGWGMGIGGGIALILIVISTFMIMTSEGDPRKLQAGKELLTSAITGLILLVFSAYILRVIGVDLLGIFSG